MEKMKILFSQEKKRKQERWQAKKKGSKLPSIHGGRRGRRGVLLLRRRVPERSMLSLSCSSEEMEGMRVPEKAALRFEPVSVEPDVKRDRVSGDRRGAAPPRASQKKKRKKLTFSINLPTKNRASNADVDNESYFALSSMDGRHLVRLEGERKNVFPIDWWLRKITAEAFFFFFFPIVDSRPREKKRARQRAAFYESSSFLVPRLRRSEQGPSRLVDGGIHEEKGAVERF